MPVNQQFASGRRRLRWIQSTCIAQATRPWRLALVIGGLWMLRSAYIPQLKLVTPLPQGRPTSLDPPPYADGFPQWGDEAHVLALEQRRAEFGSSTRPVLMAAEDVEPPEDVKPPDRKLEGPRKLTYWADEAYWIGTQTKTPGQIRQQRYDKVMSMPLEERRTEFKKIEAEAKALLANQPPTTQPSTAQPPTDSGKHAHLGEPGLGLGLNLGYWSAEDPEAPPRSAPCVDPPLRVTADLPLKRPELQTLPDFLTSPKLTAVNTLDQVPKEWKSASPIKTKMKVPFIVLRQDTPGDTEKWGQALSAVDFGHPGQSKLASCPRNTELEGLMTRGGWPRGIQRRINGSEWPFQPDQFTEAYVLQVPWAFMGDNHVFGTSETNKKKMHFGMNRWWLLDGLPTNLYEPNGQRDKQWMASKTGWVNGSWPRVEELEGVVLSAEAWQGGNYQHFVLDVLPRLSMLLDSLVAPSPETDQTFLATASIIANVGLMSNPNNDTGPMWFWHKLGLADRLIDGIGWGLTASRVYRAPLALYVEYENAPMVAEVDKSGNKQTNQARHGVYPRGSLLPIQRALGVLDGPPQDTIVYVKRPDVRSLQCDIEAVLIDAIKKRLEREGGAVKLEVLEDSKISDTTLELMRRALMVFGVHGGGLANIALCRPGTAVVEISPIRLFTHVEHRTSKYCFYGLAQAAGLDYWTVEPSFLGRSAEEVTGNMNKHFWEAYGLDIDPRDVMDILEHVLARRNGS